MTAKSVDKPLISIIIPVYMAEEIVDELIKRVCQEAEKATPYFELILVEDGSPDDSWSRIVPHCHSNKKIKGIKLSRNFGQHNAVKAGVEQSRGDWIVVMDCDLQDDPRYISAMYKKALEGFDIIFALKKGRKHSIFKNLSSYAFHWVFNKLTNTHKIDPNLSGYTIFSRKVADKFRQFHESNKAYISVLQWLGFKYTTIEVEHQERLKGTSSYTFSKLVEHAITGLTANSEKLLHLSIYTGFSFFLFALLAVCYLALRYFLIGAQPGWTSIIALLLLCTAFILTFLGILGIYIGKIIQQVQSRPLYVIDEILSSSSEEKYDSPV